MILNSLAEKLAIKYPDRWKGRKLYPHIFRHSRLTELAAGKLNEAQIRKFAGWSAGSQMPEIYFHLDDQDIINILIKGKVKTPEPKEFKSVICPICNVENSEQNIFCWKCSNVINNEKRMEAGIHLIIQPDEIAEINKRLANNEKVIQMLTKLLFHKYTENPYPDLEVGNSGDFTDLIIGEFNKLIDKE